MSLSQQFSAGFRHQFNIDQNRAVPTCNTILHWAHALCTQGTLIAEHTPTLTAAISHTLNQLIPFIFHW